MKLIIRKIGIVLALVSLQGNVFANQFPLCEENIPNGTLCRQTEDGDHEVPLKPILFALAEYGLILLTMNYCKSEYHFRSIDCVYIIFISSYYLLF